MFRVQCQKGRHLQGGQPLLQLPPLFVGKPAVGRRADDRQPRPFTPTARPHRIMLAAFTSRAMTRQDSMEKTWRSGESQNLSAAYFIGRVCICMFLYDPKKRYQ